MDDEILFIALVSLGIGGVVGTLIGNTVNRPGGGFLFGFFLGPIGWIIVLLLPREKIGNKEVIINFHVSCIKLWTNSSKSKCRTPYNL